MVLMSGEALTRIRNELIVGGKWWCAQYWSNLSEERRKKIGETLLASDRLMSYNEFDKLVLVLEKARF